MVDIDQNKDEGFPDDVPAEDGAPAGEAPAAEEAPTSPLVKLVQALGGGKKKDAAAPAPAKAAAPKAAAPKVQATPPPPKSTRTNARAALAPPQVPMPQGPLLTIVTRNEFYRDGFRNMLRLALVEAVIIVGLLISFIFYMGTAKSQDHYFATTADGRIMQLVPLDKPNMTTAALMSWVAQATSEVMTFGFHDYQRRLQQSSRHFTQHGWETFTAALRASHIIEAMQASKQVLTASPRNAPILVQEGVINGKYRWIVKLPLQVVYAGGGVGRTDNLNLNLVIERVPSLENPNGVGIEQWIATQG